VEPEHDQRSRTNEARHDLNSFEFSNAPGWVIALPAVDRADSVPVKIAAETLAAAKGN
jgi:hypothetical protein